MATIEEIKSQIKVKNCRWCGEPLNINNIDMYPHEGGWTVDGYKEKQWLSIRCNSSKCKGYDWSLWKLGVERE